MPAGASIRDVLRPFRTMLGGIAALVMVSACTPTTIDISPDASAVPSGEPTAHGPEATGPIAVVGSGVVSDRGWRYVVYESADGLCTQLELAEVITNGCGDLLPADGDALGSVNVEDALDGGITPVDGIVSD